MYNNSILFLQMTSKREQNKERANTRLTKQQKFSIYDKFEFEEE